MNSGLWEGRRTKKALAQASVRCSMWWCSWALITSGGVAWRSVSHEGYRVGTDDGTVNDGAPVLESASTHSLHPFRTIVDDALLYKNASSCQDPH